MKVKRALTFLSKNQSNVDVREIEDNLFYIGYILFKPTRPSSAWESGSCRIDFNKELITVTTYAISGHNGDPYSLVDETVPWHRLDECLSKLKSSMAIIAEAELVKKQQADRKLIISEMVNEIVGQ